MKLKRKNLLVIVAVSCLAVFGATLAFMKDAESKKNIVEIGNIKMKLTEDLWTEGEKKLFRDRFFQKIQH